MTTEAEARDGFRDDAIGRGQRLVDQINHHADEMTDRQFERWVVEATEALTRLLAVARVQPIKRRRVDRGPLTICDCVTIAACWCDAVTECAPCASSGNRPHVCVIAAARDIPEAPGGWTEQDYARYAEILSDHRAVKGSSKLLQNPARDVPEDAAS